MESLSNFLSQGPTRLECVFFLYIYIEIVYSTYRYLCKIPPIPPAEIFCPKIVPEYESLPFNVIQTHSNFASTTIFSTIKVVLNSVTWYYYRCTSCSTLGWHDFVNKIQQYYFWGDRWKIKNKIIHVYS